MYDIFNMTGTRHFTSTAAAGLAALVLIAGCTVEQRTESGIRDRVFHYGNGTEIQGLDPHLITGVPEHHLMLAVCEGLVTQEPAGGPPVGGIAESWTVSEDGYHWEFVLRRSAVWGDGVPITAEDIVWSWNRVLSPGLGSRYAQMLYTIKNAERFHKGEIDDFSQVGVKAVGEHRVLVELEQPAGYFLASLAHYATWPVPRHVVLEHGEMDTPNTDWTREENFVCNGPFRLKEWHINQVLIVEKNPTYWDAANVWLNEIHYYPIDNEILEEKMFRSGQLHLTNVVPLNKIAAYQQEQNPALKIEPYFGTYFYRINTTIAPFSDARVRRALALALDRKAIVERVSKGGEVPAYSFTPPEVGGYKPTTSIGMDIARAQSLLAEAGYPDGEGFPQFEIVYNTLEAHRQIALAIAQMWKKNLGIDVVLTNQEWKTYIERMHLVDYQVLRAGWIGDYPDPYSFLGEMTTTGGNNNTGWSNATFDAMMSESNLIRDPDERNAFLARAEEILIDEMPVVPIYYYTRKYLLDPRVKGWHFNILSAHPPKYIYFDGSEE